MLLVSRVENADMFALYFLGKPSSIYDKDNPDWAPSQKLGYDCNKVKESSQERYNRAQERVEKRGRSEGAIALMELSKATMEETMDAGVTVEELNCKACQTDITSEYFTELIQNEETLKKENAALKEQLKQNSLSQDSFEEDNDTVLFCTGLPNWTLVLCIFNFVKDLLQSKGMLSPFQKLLMTIIRLEAKLVWERLGLQVWRNQWLNCITHISSCGWCTVPTTETLDHMAW